MKPIYTNRPYNHPADMTAMLDLIRERPPAQLLHYPSHADLCEELLVENMREATRLWEDEGGRLAGFAMLQRGETYASLKMEIPSRADVQILAGQMIPWAEAFYHQHYHGKAKTLTSSADENDRSHITLLELNGFIRQDGLTLQLERNLVEPIPAAMLPPGFTIRGLAAGEEADWVAVHRAAFGTLNMTLEYRQAMTHAPGYDSELDLVAVAPDGRLAAYVFGLISAEENEQSGQKLGYTDPVGTHPDYQRKGLSRALLLECLHRLRERGMEGARISTGSWNEAMQRAAESIGFQVIRRVILFEKQIA